MKRNRCLYIVLFVITMVLGISSRKFGHYLPAFLWDYAGDTLWALMVFLGFEFLWGDFICYTAGILLGGGLEKKQQNILMDSPPCFML